MGKVLAGCLTNTTSHLPQVILSFIITACLAICMSASIIFQEFKGKPSTIRRRLLNGYSDQQIMTGIGIQSVGLAKMGSLVPYHFFIIWMLSLLSMATHNATLLALVHDFRRDWVLRWLRQALMFVNLVLSCVYGIFVLKWVGKDLPPTLPIGCVWQVDGNGAAAANSALAYVGTIVVVAGNCVIFALATWYLHNRTQRWYKIIQLVGMVLMAGIAVGAAVRVVLLSQAFGTPSVNLADRGETEWSFGQLLGLLLLLLPLISVVEIYRGDVRVAPPVEDDKTPLFDGEMQSRPGGNRTSFQPNPFFGSQTNLFKK
jgi:hypothetical protein